MRLFLVALLLPIVVESRVTFDKSEVLDNVDLKGTNTASFRCSNGCRVFSPTKSDLIVIVDGAGNRKKSLSELADQNPDHEMTELPGGKYQLKNTGPADPSFVFYAVEKGAENYNNFYVYTDGPMLIGVFTNYTFLSATGSVYFWDFWGFAEGDPLPSVYAAGFDSFASCRPVFTARSAATLKNTAFAVNSPIATIHFPKTADEKWITVSTEEYDTIQSEMAQDSSAVYTSPGYVGCPSVGDSLYTLLPPLTRIDTSSSLTNSSGISVSINGDYSIDNQADALSLSVNSENMKLYGNNSISKKYEDTKFDIKLSWEKKENSKEGFAVQIDIASKFP